MSSTATVTAKIGAGQTATAVIIQNVASFTFDCAQSVCNIQTIDGRVMSFQNYTTITVTLSSGSYTLTLS